jgi:hypothetical protein
VTLQDENTPTTIAHHAEEAWTNATEMWSKNIAKVTDRVRSPLGPDTAIDATASLEQWFDFTKRVAKANRDYVVNLAGVANFLGGAMRAHIDALTEAVRDQARVTSATANSQLAKVADVEREQVERAE